jgi:octaprenyl-diphosphate synthase
MASTFRKTSQIERPVAGELGLLEKTLEHILKSDLSLVHGIGEHLLAKKGKRVRPVLVFLCSHLGSPDPERAVKVGAAIELIHTATLLHDDSIDKSDLRRGIPTVNKLWDDQVSVIMGDHLFCKAFSLLHEAGLEEVARVLVNGSDRMTFGEMYQMDNRGDCDISEETYLDMIMHKTAALFSSACEAGALIGGLSVEVREKLSEYGDRIGIAFQIIDDILDFVGDAERMGKPVGNDVRDGRVTLPLIVALRNAPAEEVSAIRSLVCEGGFSEGGWKTVVDCIRRRGGVEYCRGLCSRLVESAKSGISDIGECPAKTSLNLLADYVISRQK